MDGSVFNRFPFDLNLGCTIGLILQFKSLFIPLQYFKYSIFCWNSLFSHEPHRNFLLNSCAIPHGLFRFLFSIRVTAVVHLVAIFVISLLYLLISLHWWCGVAWCEVFPAGRAVAHPCKALPCGNLRLYQVPVMSPWHSGTFSATRLMKQGRDCLRKKGD